MTTELSIASPKTLQNLCKERIVNGFIDYSVLPKLLQEDFRKCKICNDVFLLNYDGYFIDWINHHKEIYYYLCFDICEPCFARASFLWWLWEHDMYYIPWITRHMCPTDEIALIKSAIIGTKNTRLNLNEIEIERKPIRKYFIDIFDFKTTGGRNSVTT